MLADTLDNAPRRRNTMLIKLIAFAALCVACAAVAAFVLLRARDDANEIQRVLDALPVAAPEALAELQRSPHTVMLETRGFEMGRVALRPTEPGATPLYTQLDCYRVYFSAGSGLCLGSNGMNGGAFSFDRNMNVVHRYDIDGIPSRVRVSPDGRYGAMTVFVSGHSYMDVGMSTRTAIVDLTNGEFAIKDLEDLEIYRDGEKFDAIDFNFWGVTFERDSNRFYATLQTGDERYLIHGDVAARRADVLRSNVECPSLSPDGTTIAYKKRVKSGLFGQEWRLQLLDVATLQERPVAEDRNVDDQVEWLDDTHLLYFVPDDEPPVTTRPDLWSVSTTGDTEPQLYWSTAASPAVVRAQ
jgi:hypothetical protein